MHVYTYTEARRKLATVLDKALEEGEALIRRKDGQVFVAKPRPRPDSPLDVDVLAVPLLLVRSKGLG